MLTTVLFFGLSTTLALASPAGPHLNGNTYTALRSSNPVPTLTFNLKQELEDSITRLYVTVGPDFVIEEADNSVRVHDFRFHRFLHIDTNSGYFSNESLYGHFRSRWALFRNNIFVIDFKHEIAEEVDFPISFERFLVEHYIGIDAIQKIYRTPPPAPSVDIDRQNMELTIDVEGVEVLQAVFDPIRFPSAAHRETFASWLIWQIRVHPKIARAIVETNMLPAHLQTVRQNFGEPEFPVLHLTFSEVSRSRGRLDVLSGLTSDMPDSPHLPKRMAQLMIDAARGKAPNRPPDDSGYIQDIRKLMSDGHHLDAALLGYHASFRHEGCAPPRDREVALCDAVVNTYRVAIGKADSANKLFQTMHLIHEEKHEQAIENLLSLRGKAQVRPDILEFMIANEIIEARRAAQQVASKQDAEQQAAARELYKDGFDRLPGTFTTALAADPYSPARYRDIANYFSLAARNLDESYHAFILEHFVVDLARALPGQTMPSIINRSTDMEAGIAEDFPTLFPKTTEVAR